MPEEQTGAKKKIPPTLIDIAVAVAIVASLLIGMFIYTGIWPPLVVVESKSMQHSADESSIGTIDTGDLVLVKKVNDKFDVTTYIEGIQNGHRSYGGYGDVIIYKPGGSDDRTPIIHRAVIYLVANTDYPSFSAPSLEQLNCTGDNAVYKLSGTDTFDNITGTIQLFNYGHNNLTVQIPVDDLITYMTSRGIPLHDGFITKGDFNYQVDQDISSSVAREPVQMDWVVGKARGEIPWFGILKLWATGSLPDDTPDNSMRNLVLVIVLIIAIPIAVEIFFWLKGRSDKSEEHPTEEEVPEVPEPVTADAADEAIENEDADDSSGEPLEDEEAT